MSRTIVKPTTAFGFRRTAVETNAQAPRAHFADCASVRTASVQRYPVGLKGVHLADAFAAVRKGSAWHQPPNTAPLDATVTDHWCQTGVWLGASGTTNGSLLLREMTIPNHQGDRRAAFLIAFPTTEEITPRDLPFAKVIAATYAHGDRALIGGITLASTEAGSTDITYTLWNPATGLYESHIARAAAASEVVFDHAHAKRLVFGAAWCADAFGASIDVAEVMKRIHQDAAPQAVHMETHERHFWREVLAPLQADLAAIAADPEWRNGATTNGGMRWHDLAAIAVQRGQRLGRMDDDDLAWRQEIHAAVEQQVTGRAREFVWQGTALPTEGAIIGRLRSETDPSARKELYSAAVQYYGATHNQPDGLFARIPVLNAIAWRYGEPSYADLVYKERCGFDTATFRQMAETYFRATEAEAREYVACLREAAGRLGLSTETVNIADAPFLAMHYTAEAMGVATPPTLTPEAAREVEVAFFKRLGFDLDRPPLDAIVADWADRDGKNATMTEALAADLRYAFITAPGGAGNLMLNQLVTRLHEGCHAIHFQYAGRAANGFMALKDLLESPPHLREGLALAVDRLLSLPMIAQSLLKDYPGFSPAYLAAWCRFQRLSNIWQTRKFFLLAMQEICLYQEKQADGRFRPFSERLGMWNRWLKDYLFVDPVPGVLFGEWAVKAHMTDRNHYLYYGAYPAGVVAVEPLVRRFVSAGTREELRAFGDALRQLFARGSALTPKDIETISPLSPLGAGDGDGLRGETGSTERR